MRECRRLESLGSDRDHSRYWLLRSHPETLFVEKIASPEMNAMNSPEAEAVPKENLKDGETQTLRYGNNIVFAVVVGFISVKIDCFFCFCDLTIVLLLLAAPVHGSITTQTKS